MNQQKKVIRSDHRVYAGVENHNTVSNDRRWRKGAECRGCRGKKRLKLTSTGVKRNNQGHRRPCLQSAGGSRSSKNGPCSHMCRRVEEDVGEKVGAWRRVDHWLISWFLPTSRSSPGAPGGGVVDRRWRSN